MSESGLLLRLRRFVWVMQRGGAERRLAAGLGVSVSALVWSYAQRNSNDSSLITAITSSVFWAALCAVVLLGGWLLWLLFRQAMPRPDDSMGETPGAVKGAEAFGVHDAVLFRRLGRKDELASLTSRVLDDQNPLTVVIGASGAGKTSLLRAGLEASLRAHPEALRVAYWEALPSDSERRFLHAVEANTDTAGRDTVVIIDQLEQLDPNTSVHGPVFERLANAARQHPPHRMRFVIAFRSEYAATWFPWEAAQDIRRAPIVEVRAFTSWEAENVLIELANELGLRLSVVLVKEVVRGAATREGVLPVDLAIGVLVLFELARRNGTSELSERDLRVAGGTEGLLAAYVQQQLDLLHLPRADRDRLVNGLLTLLDLKRNQRLAEGRAKADILQTSGIEPRLGVWCLERLAARQVRILEILGGDRVRLQHDRLAAAIRRVAASALAEHDKARLVFDASYQTWSQQRRPRFLLSGSDLRTVERHQNAFVDLNHGPDELDYLRLSQRRRALRRGIAAITVLALTVSGWAAAEAVKGRELRASLNTQGLPPDLYDHVSRLEALEIQWPLPDLRPLRRGSDLRSLTLTTTGPKFDLEGIGALTQLRSLTLDPKSSFESDLLLERLHEVRFLESLTLDLSRGRGTVDLGFLSALRGLSELKLDLTRREIASLDPLAKLEGLKSLTLKLSFSKGVSLEPLRTLKQLTSLTLDVSATDISTLDALQELTMLSSVSLDSSGCCVEQLEPLEKLKGTLTSLTLNFSGRNSLTGLAVLTKLHRLESLHLNLQNTKDTPRLNFLGQLGNVATLSLDLEHSSISTLEGMEGLQELKSLALNLYGTPVTDLGPLTRLPALKSLALDYVYISLNKGFTLEPLKKLRMLTSLTLERGTAIDVVKELNALKSLTIKADRAVDTLQQLTHLKQLESLSLGATGADELESLKALTKLTSLSLDLVDYARVKIVTGFDSLEHLTELSSLTLTVLNTNISSLGPLKGLSHLTVLSLQGPSGGMLNDLKGKDTLSALTLDLSNSRVDSLDALNEMRGLTSLTIIGFIPKSLDFVPPSVRTLRLQ